LATSNPGAPPGPIRIPIGALRQTGCSFRAFDPNAMGNELVGHRTARRAARRWSRTINPGHVPAFDAGQIRRCPGVVVNGGAELFVANRGFGSETVAQATARRRGRSTLANGSGPITLSNGLA